MSATPEFSAVAKPKKNRAPSPFCIRLSDDERAQLKAEAAGKPVSTYARWKLLGDKVQKRRAYRKPKVNDAVLAQVLAALGNSHLSSNLNQLAKAANIGTLPLTPDVVEEIEEACAAVSAMRRDLIEALGLMTESEDT